MRLPRLPGDPVVYGLVAIVLLSIIIGLAQYSHTNSVNRQSYDRCVNRQVNTDKLNSFARRMAAVETGRVAAAYGSLVLAEPKCGEKP